MNKQWTVWAGVVCVVAVILFAFNYKSRQESVPLTKIFSEELGDQQTDQPVEYEFVSESGEKATTVSAVPTAIQETAAAVPATGLTATDTTVPTVNAGTTTVNKDGAYAIQISAYKDKTRAGEALKKVQAAGYPAYIVSKEGQKGVMHKIYVGTYSTKGDANENLSKLRADYKDCFIISVR